MNISEKIRKTTEELERLKKEAELIILSDDGSEKVKAAWLDDDGFNITGDCYNPHDALRLANWITRMVGKEEP